MRKCKIASAICLALVLLCMAVVPAFATTYYYSSGYELYHDSNSTNGWIINSCSLADNEISLPARLLDEDVTAIGGMAFQNRSALTYVYIPDSFNIIGTYAFDGCTSLSEVVFGENLQNINFGAFRYCDSLTTLDLSQTKLSLIANAAFYDCDNLKEVALPDTLESIGANTFANCPSLNKIVIGRNVTKIAASAFNNSPNTVIYCYYDSYAYQFACEKNISCILLDGIKLGDANGDGYVNVNDVTAIQRHAAELELLEGINFHAADINGDGNVSVDDATELQRFLAEYVVDYPIGEVMTQ